MDNSSLDKYERAKLKAASRHLMKLLDIGSHLNGYSIRFNSILTSYIFINPELNISQLEECLVELLRTIKLGCETLTDKNLNRILTIESLLEKLNVKQTP